MKVTAKILNNTIGRRVFLLHEEEDWDQIIRALDERGFEVKPKPNTVCQCGKQHPLVAVHGYCGKCAEEIYG